MTPHGCFNRIRRDTITAQDGWITVSATDATPTRLPRMVELPDPMTRHCQYARDTQDSRCNGCTLQGDAAP